MILFLGLKHGIVYFASWGKSCAGVILPFVEYVWFKWSHNNTIWHTNGQWV